jgi:hypothetical protein
MGWCHWIQFRRQIHVWSADLGYGVINSGTTFETGDIVYNILGPVAIGI